MFTFLREKMKKIVFWIVAAAFLFTIFAFWGADYDSGQFQGNIAFTVNGEDITIRAYEEAVTRRLEQMNNQDITEAIRRSIRRQVADDLIGQKILEQNSEKMGIHVTKEELKGHVRAEFPNEDLYQNYLRQAPAAWWQMIEESTDRRIKVSRARWPILDAVWVSDTEWAKIMSDLYWEADVSHILFNPSAEVTDSDIRLYYENNRYRILEPVQVRTRQILFKVARDAADTEVGVVTEKAKKVLELAKAGKDFAALAQKYSEAPDAEDGGDMGFYKQGDMIADVEAAAFRMNEGDVSDLIRTEFGVHILKLEKRVPASIRIFTRELADELRDAAVTDTHVEESKSRAQRVLETIQKFPDQFEILARLQSHAPSRKTGGHIGWMPRLVFPSGYDQSPLIGEVTRGTAVEREISQAVFSTPDAGVADTLVRSSFGWHILKIHARRPISSTLRAPTDTDVAMVRNTYLRLLSEETLLRWVQEERKRADVKFKIDIES